MNFENDFKHYNHKLERGDFNYFFSQIELEEIYKKSKYFKDCLNEVSVKLKRSYMDYEEKEIFFETVSHIAKTVFDLVKKMKENNCKILATTETAATPYGYAVKKVFQRAFNEKIKVIPINVKIRHLIENIFNLKVKIKNKVDEKDYEKYYKFRDNIFRKIGIDYRNKLKKLNISLEDKIFVFDEIDQPRSKFIAAVEEENFSIDKIYDASALSTAVIILKLAGFKNIVVKPVHRGVYIEGPLKFGEYKNKKISWKENTSRVLNAPDIKPLYSYLLNQTPKEVLKYYFEIEKNFPSRVPLDRERAKAIIFDMKLIGEFVAEKFKNKN